MGDDFSEESEEENLERKKNPLMCDTPRLTLPEERQAQAEKFYEVSHFYFYFILTQIKE